MRILLLLLSLFAASASVGFAQAPTPAPAPAQPRQAPAPAPAQPGKAPAQPRPRRAPPASTGRSGIAMTVTDGEGAPLSGVHVELTGPMTNAGDTSPEGQINFPGLQPGTYRLRFTGEQVTAFEREVTLRGTIERLDIRLTPTPAVRPAPAPAPPAAPAALPTGTPQLGSLTNLADRERNTKEPRREILLSCSGNTRNMLLVLTQEQAQRVYDSAEATYYVISGQGTARVGSLQSVIGSGSFIAVPRGTPFSLARQGNRPLAMLWTLSGEPCEEAR